MFNRLTTILLLLCFATAVAVRADDDPQAQQDTTIVETLLRLENFDLESSAKGKAAVERFLKRNPGSDQYFELIQKYKIASAADDLIRIAIEKSGETSSVRAVQILFQLNQDRLLTSVLNGHDADQATSIATAVGLSNNRRAVEMLGPLIVNTKRTVAIRSAAARALGRSTSGQQQLLTLVVEGKLPADLKFTAADILLASRDANIKATAAKHLEPPASAGETPLPPVAQLIRRRGNAANGHQVFTTKGTCSKCHQVGEEGKNIGPALTEIGSKLAKEAMYVAILDPSAGISHNFESYMVVTVQGVVTTGLMISQTDDAVTVRTAEGIDQTFKMIDVDEVIKQKTSLMPGGLQKLMSVDELVDLVEYLQTLKKK